MNKTTPPPQFVSLVIIYTMLVFLVTIPDTTLAGNFTWTGTVNKNWNTAANWSPIGVPSTNDTVNITVGSDTLLLSANTTISRLLMSGRTLHLSGYELEVSDHAAFSGGKIYDGILKLRGSSVTFAGTHTDCQIDCIAAQLLFNGGLFDGEGNFEQNGTTASYGNGGCVFNAPVIIKKSTNAILRLGAALPDTFNSLVAFICENKQPLEISYGSASVFNDRVSLSCYGNFSEIKMGNDSHTVQLNNEASLATGEEGLHDGIVMLKRISQSSTAENELSGADNLILSMECCSFNGPVMLAAPSILLKNSVLMGDAILTKTQAASNNYSYGGNAFYGNVTLENQDGTYGFRFANQTGDHFYKEVTFNAESRRIQMGYTGISYFEGDISVNSSDVNFNSGSGKLVLKGNQPQTLEGTHSYLMSKLEIDKNSGTIQLNQQMIIDSTIIFVNGIINTDSLITLNEAATVIGASNQSFVDGAVKKIGNTAFVFPVGDNGSYQPLSISGLISNTEAYSARFIYKMQKIGNSKDTILDYLNLCSYWDLKRNSGSNQIKVAVSWDSLGCGLFDTVDVVVVNWNGSKWISLGNDSIDGDVVNGTMFSQSIVTNYTYLTWGYLSAFRDAPLVTITPTLCTSSGVPYCNHSMQPNYFGFNGNTIRDQTSWYDLDNDALLSNSPIRLLRIPAGTVANYWDWRKAWFLEERDLPNNWFYFQTLYSTPAPSTVPKENDFSYVSLNNRRICGDVMVCWNMLTSDFEYQLASLYKLHKENLRVKYVELGNEFYLNDKQYKDVFPSVINYTDKSNEWCKRLKEISPFSTNVKVAILGADISPNGIPGRRRLWLDKVLENIDASDPNKQVDAITIHNYIQSGLNNSLFLNSDVTTMLANSFKEFHDLNQETLLKIRIANLNKFQNHPLEIWVTEYNLLENNKNNKNIGTWAHGLFNAILALSYTENELITKIISHTMISDAVFGNYFDSNLGFQFVVDGQIPQNISDKNTFATRKGEFTALGSALNQVAIATRDAEHAYKIDFSSYANNISTISIGTNSYLDLYGWAFDSPRGRQIVIVNASKNSYLFNPTSMFDNGSNIDYEMIWSAQPNAGIAGNPQLAGPSTGLISELYTDGILNYTVPITINAFSIIRFFTEFDNPTLHLSDDEVCFGSEVSLQLLGGVGSSFQITAVCSTGSFNLSSMMNNDIQIINTGGLPAATYTIYATYNGNQVASINLDIRDNIDPSFITVTPSTVSSICAGDEVTLSAEFTTVSGITPSNYSFIWVPDSFVTSSIGSCASSNSDLQAMRSCITVAPTRTTDYQVYVTDGMCWTHSDVVQIPVKISRVDAGGDKIVCTGDEIEIIGDAELQGTTNIKWYSNNTLISGATSLNLLITPSNDVVIKLEIDDGSSCLISDEMNLMAAACCTSNITCQANSTLPIFTDQDIVLNSNYSSNITNDERIIQRNTGSSAEISINTIFTVVGGSNYKNLKFINCHFNLGEYASIVMDGNHSLEFVGCTFEDCGNLWNSIIVDTKASKTNSIITLTNCTLSGAETAVQLFRNADYRISGCIFNNNYKDIKIEDYPTKISESSQGISNGIPTMYYIFGNEFTSSAPSLNQLISPRVNEYKESAIDLHDVENVILGNASSPNIIKNSYFGIKGFQSGFEVYNTVFEGIKDYYSQAFPPSYVGSAIYANNLLSSFLFWDRSVIVGATNNTSTPDNYFKNSRNGVYLKGDLNSEIRNNIFGVSGAPDQSISLFGIRIENVYNNAIAISGVNVFYDFNKAISIFNLYGRKSTLSILNNDFINSISTGNSINFHTTAINIDNVLPVNLPLAEIKNNNPIGNSSSGTRIGIHARNIGNLDIINNTINFIKNNGSTNYHNGIWLENCMEAEINDNKIENKGNFTPTISTASQLVGIELSDCISPCIKSNDVISSGYGIFLRNTSLYTLLWENIMNEFYTGIQLDNSDLGKEIGQTENTYNNKWLNNTSSRVEGILSTSSSSLTWHYKDNANNDGTNSANEFKPVSSNPDIDDEYNQSPLYESEPACEQVIIAHQRNASIGGIILDTNRYVSEYEEELKFSANNSAYKFLNFHQNYLNLDDTMDIYFQEFYSKIDTSNIGYFHSISDTISNNYALESIAIFENIKDSTFWDESSKVFLSMYAANVAGLDTLNYTDSIYIENLANTLPLLVGTSSYMAASWLELEVHHQIESSGSRLSSNTSAKEYLELKLFPNPVNSDLNVTITPQQNTGIIEIFDLSLRSILKIPYSNTINIANLISGVYLLKFSNDNIRINKKFIKL
jgi:Secretion system C-terminal sorting domain